MDVECYQGSRPLRPVRVVRYAGLAALYDRELGHLMIWPPGHFQRSGRAEVALADETGAARS